MERWQVDSNVVGNVCDGAALPLLQLSILLRESINLALQRVHTSARGGEQELLGGERLSEVHQSSFIDLHRRGLDRFTRLQMTLHRELDGALEPTRAHKESSIILGHEAHFQIFLHLFFR